MGPLTPIKDLNENILSLLTFNQMLSLRIVSKETKKRVEECLFFKKKFDAIPSANSSMLWNNNFPGLSPFFIHSNGEHLRVLSYDCDKFTRIKETSYSSLTFQKICTWKKVIWGKDAVAITTPSYDYLSDLLANAVTKKRFSTQILHTESGKYLEQIENSLLEPVCWQQSGLIFKDTTGFSSHFYFLKDTQLKPIAVIKHFQLEFATMLDDKLFFLSSDNSLYKGSLLSEKEPSLLTSFSNKDLILHLTPTEAGNLFFSQTKHFFLVSGDKGTALAQISLPFSPRQIAFLSPFVACYSDTCFLVYDIRKHNSPLFEYNYISWKRKLSNLFDLNSYLPFSIPNEDLKIRSLAFHNSSLYLSKSDGSLDCFNLTANTWSWNLF